MLCSAGFDVLISTTCLVLMYYWNQDIYRTVCCCFTPKKDAYDENESNIALEIATNASRPRASSKNTAPITRVNTASSSAADTECTIVPSSPCSPDTTDINVIDNVVTP